MCAVLFFFYVGYMTTTKIKFMASIEDSDDNGRKHFAREAGLKAMFVSFFRNLLYSNEWYLIYVKRSALQP